MESASRPSSHRSAVSDATILQINPDVFWSIIKLNTDIFSTEDALTSTRHYSQVCQSWRQFILQSSPLWGKLIDLNELRQSTEMWRTEVLLRSGTSLLWIKGNIYGEPPRRSPTLLAFFFSLLNNHWDKIQKIDVSIPRDLKGDIRCDWSAIYRPTPHLQVFRAQSELPKFASDIQLWSSSLPLFAHNAPSLVTFNARLPISLHAPWLSSLCAICLGFPLTLPQILDVLREIRPLESLEILPFFEPDGANEPTIRVDQPSVRLPNLTELSMSTGLTTSLDVLAYFQVPPGGSLAIKPIPNPSKPLKDIWMGDSHMATLSKFSQNYFHSHLPSKLWVGSSLSDFTFSDYDPSERYSEIKATPFFSVILLHSVMMPDTNRHLIRTLSLSCPDLGSVVHLNLTVRKRLPDTFITFVSALISIETLTVTDTLTFRYLMQAQEHHANTFFPLLRVLRLDILHEYQDPLFSFLHSRKTAGYPVQVLDLTSYKVPSYSSLKPVKPVEERLRGIAGLAVIWPK